MAAAGFLGFLMYSQTMAVIVLMCILMFAMNLTNACDPELYANCAAYSGKN